ncbi:unnamed protein product [Somion occarium]|uniref:Glucose-methanol-choline oxidoreductase N-terminal domain-containing protein n=1 Tax=Somion occarium TaxID=3059160 RepID=A0ABP1DRJ9_9APHY
MAWSMSAMVQHLRYVNPGGKVILAAGTFQTPKLLELSGIGNTTLLEKYGFISEVDLLGVGENLQDHLPFKAGLGQSIEDLARNMTFVAEQTTLYLHNSDSSQFSELSLTIPLCQTSNWCCCLVLLTLASLPAPVHRTLSIAAVSMHPFSRGNVHINASDPTKLARLDPNHLGNDFVPRSFGTGRSHQVHRTTFKNSTIVKPYSSITKQLLPIPDSSDIQLANFIRSSVFSSWHPVGPTAALPWDQGGVLSSNLKGYGTRNVYVADASIIPLPLGFPVPIATLRLNQFN